MGQHVTIGPELWSSKAAQVVVNMRGSFGEIFYSVGRSKPAARSTRTQAYDIILRSSGTPTQSPLNVVPISAASPRPGLGASRPGAGPARDGTEITRTTSDSRARALLNTG